MRTRFRCDGARARAFRSLVVAVLGLVPVAALAQMPNLGQMSGTPLPAGDLPTGTVSVRLVRGDLTNPVAGHKVELHGPVTLSAVTDETGRATFSNVVVGGSWHAHVEVNGESLSSQNFPIPATGGVRVILAAGVASAASAPPAEAGAPVAAAPAGPASPGTIVLGGQSRIGVEFTEEGVDVYLLFDLANTGPAPVTTEPLAFEVPDGATSLTVLENSSPQAKTDGRRFVVTGPFAPGLTTVQMAYRLPVTGGRMSFTQRVPADLVTTNLFVRKVGNLQFRSPQAGSVREVAMQDGSPYYLASGQRLAAGGGVEVVLDGVPHHSRVPRYLALGLAVFVIGFGVWLSANGPDEHQAAERRRLEAQRETLLGRLADLERQRGTGGDPVRLDARREHLVEQLEGIYAQLDHAVAGAPVAAAAASPAPEPVGAGAAVSSR